MFLTADVCPRAPIANVAWVSWRLLTHVPFLLPVGMLGASSSPNRAMDLPPAAAAAFLFLKSEI